MTSTYVLSPQQVIRDVYEAIKKRHRRHYLGPVPPAPKGWGDRAESGKVYPSSIATVGSEGDIHRNLTSDFAFEGYGLRSGDEVVIVAVGEPTRLRLVDIEFGLLANTIPRLTPKGWKRVIGKDPLLLGHLWFDKGISPFQIVEPDSYHADQAGSELCKRNVYNLDSSRFHPVALRFRVRHQVIPARRLANPRAAPINSYRSTVINSILDMFDSRYFPT